MEPDQQQSSPTTPPPSRQLDPEAARIQKLHPMVVMQPGERMVATVKRHPFGILSLYFGAAIAVAVIIALAILLPSVMNQYTNTDFDMTPIYAGAGIFVALLVLILWIATTVYWQNEWVVTTDSITQISQRSLFNRQVSQLSMDNLEDVTVNQNGLLPSMFNFGTLKVETAGERSKFSFPYCPNPNDYARRILEVHEDFLEVRRNVGRNTP